MIELIDKLKSRTVEGKVCDYTEVDGAPEIQAVDMTTITLATGYYQHTGETTKTYTKGMIYYYDGKSLQSIDGVSGIGEQEVEDIIDERLQHYVQEQALEEARYDLRAYGFVPATSDSEIDITTSEAMRVKGKVISLTADFGDINLVSGDSCSLGLSDVATFSSATHAPIFFEGNVKLSEKYAPKDLSSYNFASKEDLAYEVQEIYGDLRGYASKTDVQNHAQNFDELYAGSYNLGNYFQEFDTYYGDNYDVSSTAEGIVWNNSFDLVGENGSYQGKYWGNVPIVAGDNVTFTVDDANQVVKINANVDVSNFATETYVANAISDLVDSSPETLNTLNELAAALGDDPNFATTVSTEIGKKQNTITGAATTITGSNLTANRALISNGSGKVAVSDVTSTELGYLDGVTSNIQTQLNGKLSATGKAASATVADSAFYQSR